MESFRTYFPRAVTEWIGGWGRGFGLTARSGKQKTTLPTSASSPTQPNPPQTSSATADATSEKRNAPSPSALSKLGRVHFSLERQCPRSRCFSSKREKCLAVQGPVPLGWAGRYRNTCLGLEITLGLTLLPVLRQVASNSGIHLHRAARSFPCVRGIRHRGHA